MPLAAGSRLGPYRIHSLIGAGAMGEVYRARDIRLERDVAVKIIPEEASSDVALRRRFEQEAQAASALNHPNIVTVHDLGHESSVSFIVTELIDGEPLRKLIQRGLLPMRKTLDIGVQIADGLAAAHDAGIVHRDLKPENAMITRDGRVKILDFGLAKPFDRELSGHENDTLGTNPTSAGLLVGTAAYMSPEQARGAKVRFYSDQFALGVILYEMATGKQAFRRGSPMETISAILNEEAPPLNCGPIPFRWLVARCLHKDPEHRYASTRDLLRELENIRTHLTETISTTGPPPDALIQEPRREPRRIGIRWRYVLPALALALVFAVGIAVGRFAGAGPATDLSKQRFIPLATSSELEVFPSWAPSGKTVAYAADVNGTFQIFTRTIGAAMPAQLTRSHTDCLFPFWSPDGARAYYISSWQQRPALWSVGATGGSPELVVENATQAAVAPDGSRLAILRKQGDDDTYSLWMGTLGDRDLQRYDRPPFGGKRLMAWSYLRFSPDGRSLAAWVSLSQGASELWLIPTDGGAPEQMLSQLTRSPLAKELSWMPDSRQIVFSERSGVGVGAHLWIADMRTGRLGQITNGTGAELSPSIAADGKSIAFSSISLDYDVVQIPFADGAIQDVLATPLPQFSPSVSARGQYAYVTEHSGRPEIWLYNPIDQTQRPLVTQEAFGRDQTIFLFDLAFSPDGQRIAYRRAGEKDEVIWISTVTGDPPVRLAREPGETFQRGPTWSPDGNSIAYFTMRDGRYVLMRARAGGLEAPAVLAENAGTFPRWSPRGDWIACIGSGEGVALVSPTGNARRTVGTGTWLLHGWSADGRLIYGVIRTPENTLALTATNPITGAQLSIRELGPYPGAFSYGAAIGMLPLRGFTIAPDRKSFITSMLRPRADIWILALERPEKP